MDFKHIWLILYAIIELGLAQTDEVCDINKARVSLKEYNTLVKNHYVGHTLESFRFLCLSQIIGNNITLRFENSIKLCNREPELDSLLAEWNSLADQVRQSCQQKCPNIFELTKCEDMIVDEKIKQQQFEEFCRTFANGLECALENLSGCDFQINVYYDTLKPKMKMYWDHICNSGCKNLDQTVAHIDGCIRHLRNIKNKGLKCSSHWAFRDCVLLNGSVCPEVLTLVKQRYISYDSIEHECFTTTAKPTEVTTTKVPTTSTTNFPSTTGTLDTSSLSTEGITDLEDFTVDSRDQADTESSYQAIIDMCIVQSNVSEKELEDSGLARLLKHQILAIFRFESCLLKNSENAVDTLIPYRLPTRYLDMLYRAKLVGYDVIYDSLEKCTESSKISGTPSSASKGYSKSSLYEMMVIAVAFLAQWK